MPVFVFNAGMSGSRGDYRPIYTWNKYNPKYNFRTMK